MSFSTVGTGAGLTVFKQLKREVLAAEEASKMQLSEEDVKKAIVEAAPLGETKHAKESLVESSEEIQQGVSDAILEEAESSPAEGLDTVRAEAEQDHPDTEAEQKKTVRAPRKKSLEVVDISGVISFTGGEELSYSDDIFGAEWLGNFYPAELTIDVSGKSMSFKNSEAAYQAVRRPSQAHKYVDLTGAQAWALAQTQPIETPKSQNLTHMSNVLQLKFSQNPTLKEKLMCPTPTFLMETDHHASENVNRQLLVSWTRSWTEPAWLAPYDPSGFLL